jgi:hypothetical protein
VTEVAEIQADIDALKGFRDALIRYRYVQRDVAERGNQEIEKTRASLAAKAKRWQSNLQKRQADLDACLRAAAYAAGGAAPYARGGPPFARGGPVYGRGGYAPDCSRLASAVREAEERLKHIHDWQRKVEQEASAFRGTANRFRSLVENDVPRAERHLLAIINGLEAARGIQITRP